MQDARVRVDELMLGVVVPVDDLPVRKSPIGWPGKRMAVHQHHESVY
jgi:hypothetical protein